MRGLNSGLPDFDDKMADGRASSWPFFSRPSIHFQPARRWDWIFALSARDSSSVEVEPDFWNCEPPAM